MGVALDGAPRRQDVAGLRPLAHVAVRELGDPLPGLVGLPDDGHTSGGLDRQRPQQDDVDGAEDGAVGADSEREGQDGGGRVARRAAKVSRPSVL